MKPRLNKLEQRRSRVPDITGVIRTDIAISHPEFNIKLKKEAFDRMCEDKNVPIDARNEMWQNFTEINKKISTDADSGGHTVVQNSVKAISDHIAQFRKHNSDFPPLDEEEIEGFTSRL